MAKYKKGDYVRIVGVFCLIYGFIEPEDVRVLAEIGDSMQIRKNAPYYCVFTDRGTSYVMAEEDLEWAPGHNTPLAKVLRGEHE